MIKHRKRIKLNGFGVVSLVLLGTYSLAMLFILYFALTNSLKTMDDFVGLNNIFGLPTSSSAHPEYGSRLGWKFSNYRLAWTILSVEEGGMLYTAPSLFVHSLLYAGGCTIIATASHLVAAYACAKYEFKGKALLYATAIVTMIIPIVGALPSQISIMRMLGFYDNYLGNLIFRGGYTGTYFLVFYATYKGISWTYAEAAELDGAGPFAIFWHVMIPLARNSITAVALMLFIQFWNDYSIPMILLPSMPTIAFALYQVSLGGKTGNAMTLMKNLGITGYIPREECVQLAATMIVTVPTLVMFIIFRNKIMGNITMGGLKG